MAEEWIWVPKWEEFQHYAPERDRAPAWIKDYLKQRADDRYRDLSLAMRGLLSELRAEFAQSRSKLRADPKRLSSRLGATVKQHQLKTLSDAGYIEFCSRETLDRRLEAFYASRARPRARGEVRSKKLEREGEKAVKAVTPTQDAARPRETLNGRTALESHQQALQDRRHRT